jgi:putative RNA 2'-phosphotransferase
MISEKETIRISKLLSLVLRHKPEVLGIHLDSNGWADVDILLDKIKQNGEVISIETLRYVVETNNKKRFAFNENGDKIRASQGHSLEVDLGYTSQTPPSVLYHGTGKNAVQSILSTGIEKRNRQHVHLSANIETAIQVGQRHGQPFVFEVLALQMHKDNFSFYLSENGVWLTDNIPPQYLRPHNQ